MPDRMLRASITTSPNLNACGIVAQLMFVRLLVSVDDTGRFMADVPAVRSLCFPLMLDAVSVDDVTLALDDLEAHHLIVRYAVGERAYLRLASWDRHQSLTSEVSKYPTEDGKTLADVRRAAVRQRWDRKEDTNPNKAIQTDTNPNKAIQTDTSPNKAIQTDTSPNKAIQPGTETETETETCTATAAVAGSGGRWTNKHITSEQASEVVGALRQTEGWQPDDAQDLKLVCMLANQFRSPAVLLQAACEFATADGRAADGTAYKDLRRAYRAFCQRCSQRPAPMPRAAGDDAEFLAEWERLAVRERAREACRAP